MAKTCPHCSKSFAGDWQCSQHIRDAHPATRRTALGPHMKTRRWVGVPVPGVHPYEDYVACYECKQMFRTESACQTHARTKGHLWSKEVLMDLTEEERKLLLSNHRIAKTPRRARRYKPVKPKKPPVLTPEQAREQAIAARSRNIICVYCWYEWRNQDEYREHVAHCPRQSVDDLEDPVPGWQPLYCFGCGNYHDRTAMGPDGDCATFLDLDGVESPGPMVPASPPEVAGHSHAPLPQTDPDVSSRVQEGVPGSTSSAAVESPNPRIPQEAALFHSSPTDIRTPAPPDAPEGSDTVLSHPRANDGDGISNTHYTLPEDGESHEQDLEAPLTLDESIHDQAAGLLLDESPRKLSEHCSTHAATAEEVDSSQNSATSRRAGVGTSAAPPCEDSASSSSSGAQTGTGHNSPLIRSLSALHICGSPTPSPSPASPLDNAERQGDHTQDRVGDSLGTGEPRTSGAVMEVSTVQKKDGYL